MNALETCVKVGAWVAAVLVLGLILTHGLISPEAQKVPSASCPEFIDLELAQHDPAYFAMVNSMSPACKAWRKAHQGRVVIGPGTAK
jgi:hypothetical protein